MKLSRGKLAELKRMGYVVEDTPVPDEVILTPVPKPVKGVAAPDKTEHTSLKQWKFTVQRDDFGFIESINASQII